MLSHKWQGWFSLRIGVHCLYWGDEAEQLFYMLCPAIWSRDRFISSLSTRPHRQIGLKTFKLTISRRAVGAILSRGKKAKLFSRRYEFFEGNFSKWIISQAGQENNLGLIFKSNRPHEITASRLSRLCEFSRYTHVSCVNLNAAAALRSYD